MGRTVAFEKFPTPFYALKNSTAAIPEAVVLQELTIAAIDRFHANQQNDLLQMAIDWLELGYGLDELTIVRTFKSPVVSVMPLGSSATLANGIAR